MPQSIEHVKYSETDSYVYCKFIFDWYGKENLWRVDSIFFKEREKYLNTLMPQKVSPVKLYYTI
jgi:hypothetical protein